MLNHKINTDFNKHARSLLLRRMSGQSSYQGILSAARLTTQRNLFLLCNHDPSGGKQVRWSEREATTPQRKETI